MSTWQQPEPSNWWTIVDDAMQEDLGSGDVTSGCLSSDQKVSWYVEAQADGIICGLGVAEYLFAPYPQESDKFEFQLNFVDGDSVQRGDRILEGTSEARRALMAERTMLNFLMHLSGISTLTAEFVNRCVGTNARILDTRKTLPTLRQFAKYAVRCGGGHNHRMGLFDGVLIKDNHIRACGSLTAAIESVRSYAPNLLKVEVECSSLALVAEAVEAGADIIMLDNMDPFQMREAVKAFEGRTVFEASGGITLDTVRGVALTGVDFISVGALTHSAPSLPLHMELD